MDITAKHEAQPFQYTMKFSAGEHSALRAGLKQLHETANRYSPLYDVTKQMLEIMDHYDAR